MVVAHNTAAAPPILNGSMVPPVTIPVVAIARDTGTAIKAALPAAGSVRHQQGPARDARRRPSARRRSSTSTTTARRCGLTGGPNINCLNGDEQAGEGWSDFFAITFLMNPAIDDPNKPRGYGQWALYADSRIGPGFRPAPYSRDMALKPFTYDSIKTNGWLDGTSLALPHGLGSGWAAVLWDMAWDLVDMYGFNPNAYGKWDTGGNNRAIQYVMDGLKMQGCNPGLVVARAAIIAAAAGADRRRGHVPAVGGVRAPRPRLQRRPGRHGPQRQHRGVRHASGLPARLHQRRRRTGVDDDRGGIAVSVAVQGGRRLPRVGHRQEGQPVLASGRLHDAGDGHAGPDRDHAAAAPGRRGHAGRHGAVGRPRTATYTYPWQTDVAWGNTCREFVFTTKTGVQHRAYFKFLAATHTRRDRRRHGAGDARADARYAGDLRGVPPGVARDYDATTTANVISTAGSATLSVADAELERDRPAGQRRVLAAVRGAGARDQRGRYRVRAGRRGRQRSPTTLLTYTAPVSNDDVTLAFRQSIGANDALRTGTYSKTLTFTLSTTEP